MIFCCKITLQTKYDIKLWKEALAMSNEEFESFEPDLISLLDEDGNEYEFEILDEIDFKDSHFYALMPL